MKKEIKGAILCGLLVCTAAGCSAPGERMEPISSVVESVSGDVMSSTQESSAVSSAAVSSVASMAAAASGGDTQTPAPEEPTWEEPALEEPAPAPAPVPEEPTWEEPANQGYEKTAEEANWLCQEFVRAASEHQAAIQSYVDVEYNAKIESLEEDLENNNASCEAQIAQLYRNTGDIANNRTLLAALQVQEQNIRQQYGRYNNEIEGQITQLQQMRDAYIQEYDTGSYVFERMSENTGLSVEELNILMFDIYEEEVTSYLSSLE